MIGRIVRSADFVRVLARPVRARSAHFAAHHLPMDDTSAEAPEKPSESDLSTGRTQNDAQPVDDACWLGTVVPKRNARRAVTRSLVKRQMRQAALRHRDHLASGWWVVRMHAPFERRLFPSAASGALREAVHMELDLLLARLRADGRR